jgi:hypothetical protein
MICVCCSHLIQEIINFVFYQMPFRVGNLVRLDTDDKEIKKQNFEITAIATFASMVGRRGAPTKKGYALENTNPQSDIRIDGFVKEESLIFIARKAKAMTKKSTSNKTKAQQVTIQSFFFEPSTR